MPTDVIRKIGATNTPTTMDYTSLQAWADACPTDLTSVDQRWIGECYDQGKFTSGVTIGSGKTTDATRNIILRCASGASFASKAGVRTSALTYNSTTGSGVAVEVSAAGNVTLAAQYTVLDGIQVKTTGYGIAITSTANCTARNCIATRTGGAGSLAVENQTSAKWVDCLFVYQFTSGTALSTIGQHRNCTVVNVAGAGTSAAFKSDYDAALALNCAVFGFNAATASGNSLNSASDYNGSDLASIPTAGGGGTHNATSLTFASCFANPSSDFRATYSSAGSNLHRGTPDATYSPTDISGFTRDATTPYIGAWEASVPPAGFTIAPSAIPKNHAGNITLTLTGSGTSWSNASTVFTPSGVAGVVKVSQSVTSATAATVVVTTGTGTGTLTLTESVTGTNTATTTVGVPAVAVSPTSVTVSSTATLTLTGTNTVWSQETAAGLFSVTATGGNSIGTPTVTSNTAATAVLTVGPFTGTLTLVDNSTGATTTITAAAVSGSLAVTSPTAYHGFRRDGSNQASIPISGTYTGGPGTPTIEASFNGGAYATIATGTGGTFSGSLPSQASGQGTLSVRFVAAPTIGATVANVTIGAVIGIAGQSNAVGVVGTTNDGTSPLYQSYSNGAGLKATVYAAGNSSYTAAGFWREANDPFVNAYTSGGSAWPLLATHLMNDLGCPVIFVETAIGGRGLCWYWTKYRPDTGAPGSGSTGPTTGYGEISATCASAATGGLDAMIWYQGENDVDTGIARTVYGPALQTFANNVAADVANAPKLAVVQFGHNGGESGVPASQSDAIKLAISDAILASRAGGGNLLDGMVVVSDFSNTLHTWRVTDAQTIADRMFALLKSEVFGGTPGNGRGPVVVACQYDAARTTITVGFDKVLKTGLVHDASLWSVTGNGSAATVSAVAYHATDTRALVLTLTSAAALPILVSFALGGSTAGKVWPRGPDVALPAGAGTINLPAEMFSGVQAAAAQVTSGGTGGGNTYSRGRLVNA